MAHESNEVNLQLEIVSLLNDGRGLARPVGSPVVFVEGSLPGELVEVCEVRRRKQYREAVTERVLQVSPVRVAPRCPIFQRCGGCRLQHLREEAQAPCKKEWFLDAIRRLGHWPEDARQRAAEIMRVHVLDSWAYRQRVRVHFDGNNLGFRARRSHAVVGLPANQSCAIAHPRIQSVWSAFASLLWQSQGLASSVSEWELTVANGGQVVVEPVGDSACAMLQQAGGSFACDWIFQGDYFPVSHIHRGVLQCHRRGFVQPHQQAMNKYAEVLTEGLRSWLINKPAQSLWLAWDLFSGCGAFSSVPGMSVSGEQQMRVVAVEGIAEAVAALRRNYGDEVEGICQDVHQFVQEGFSNQMPQIVIVDPPRAGLGLHTSDRLATSLHYPAWVAYVACDPAALARDGARFLQKGFSLASLDLFDAFPQTEHYEVIAVFVKD